jgi:glycosyltransferase involved in cell wall biosynthesis
LKICFIAEHFPPHLGGGEKMFKEYSARLAQMGCEVKVITSNSGGLTGRFIEDGAEIHRFPWKSFFGHPVPRKGDLQEFVAWSDIVHTGTYTAAPAAFAVAEKHHKPCIITVFEALREKWFWVEKNKLKAALFYVFEQYIVKKKYAFYQAISYATEKDLLACKINKDSISVIHLGVEKRPWPQLTEEKSLIGEEKSLPAFL